MLKLLALGSALVFGGLVVATARPLPTASAEGLPAQAIAPAGVADAGAAQEPVRTFMPPTKSGMPVRVPQAVPPAGLPDGGEPRRR